MSAGSLQGAVASGTLAAGICQSSMLQASDWIRVSTPVRHYFPTYISATDWHQGSV